MRWRVYSSGTFLGFATADSEPRALDRARLLYGPLQMQVVTEAAWATLSAAARAIIAYGKAEKPERPRDENGVIIYTCRKCHKPVPQRPPQGKTTGRPRRIHDECLSPGQRKWRYDPRRHANQRKYRQARKKQRRMENAA